MEEQLSNYPLSDPPPISPVPVPQAAQLVSPTLKEALASDFSG